MKKIFSVFILIFLLLLNTVVIASDVPEEISVNDNAGVLSRAAEKYIASQNELLSKACGAKIVVVTENPPKEMSVNEYAQLIAEQWRINSIGRSNSVLILMAPEARDYAVVISDGISGALTDVYAEKCLISFMEPDFAKKEYSDAAVKTYNGIAKWYNKNYKNVSLKLTDDISKYEKMVETEKKEANRRTAARVSAVIAVIVAVVAVILYIRKRIRIMKLRQKRRERRRRYSDLSK